MTEHTEAVVLGGGYAGVMAANRLTSRPGLRVTLVNPRPVFVDRIRLHQLAGGTGDATAPFEQVLSPKVRVHVGTVTRIDAAERVLHLEDGGTLTYGYLVYAVGSASPRVPAFAHSLSTYEEARAARQRAETARTITVVGGGPTGIETAAELAEAGKDVTLVCDRLGPYLHPKARHAVAKRLAALGVTLVEGQRIHDEPATDLTLWTAGFTVPDLAGKSGLTVDPDGRLLTDETLTSVDDPHIVAAGDAASPSGLPYRMSCQAAVQLGPQAARTVLGRIAGETPAPVEVGFAGQCLSLGRRAGLFQFSQRDDVAKSRYVGGWAGGRVKELICRSILWQLGHEARHPGARKWWLRDDARATRLAAPERVEA